MHKDNLVQLYPVVGGPLAGFLLRKTDSLVTTLSRYEIYTLIKQALPPDTPPAVTYKLMSPLLDHPHVYLWVPADWTETKVLQQLATVGYSTTVRTAAPIHKIERDKGDTQ